jgi:hypothetical protein
MLPLLVTKLVPNPAGCHLSETHAIGSDDTQHAHAVCVCVRARVSKKRYGEKSARSRENKTDRERD